MVHECGPPCVGQSVGSPEKRRQIRRLRRAASLVGNPSSPAKPVRQLEIVRHKSRKCPPIAGFCELAVGLPTPSSPTPGAKLPIVSGGCLKYSRFRETATGDWVRSALRDGSHTLGAGVRVAAMRRTHPPTRVSNCAILSETTAVAGAGVYFCKVESAPPLPTACALHCA